MRRHSIECNISGLEVLRKTVNINTKNIQYIESSYWNQKVQIRVDGEKTNAVKMQRRVLTGMCSLTSSYTQIIFQEALEDIEKGIKINGE